MLAGSEDCSMWMWNADKEAYLNMFSGHNQSVTCGDFTPDGIYIYKLLLDYALRFVYKSFNCLFVCVWIL